MTSAAGTFELTIPTLRATYLLAMQELHTVDLSDQTAHRAAIESFHYAGVNYFNAQERLVSIGAAEGLFDNSLWSQDKAESSSAVLNLIVKHYRALHSERSKCSLPVFPMPGGSTYANMQRLVAKYDATTAAMLVRMFGEIGLPTRGFTMAAKARFSSGEKWFSAICGLVFMVGIFVAAVAIPNPTKPQMFIFRVLLAIAAAAFAGTISRGLLDVHGKWKVFGVRATGAFGVFVLVYLINPPQLV